MGKFLAPRQTDAANGTDGTYETDETDETDTTHPRAPAAAYMTDTTFGQRGGRVCLWSRWRRHPWRIDGFWGEGPASSHMHHSGAARQPQ